VIPLSESIESGGIRAMGTTLLRHVLSRNIASSILSLTIVGLACFGLSQRGFSQSRFDQGSTRDRAMTPLFGNSQASWQSGQWLNSAMNQPTDWHLGVRVNNTENGVMITDVTPSSAGARARFERDDLIIAVGGYQVGMIDGLLFDLGDELRRRADSTGAVSMLVQDHRTGRIANVRVQLDGNSTSLTGELVYRERLPLPSDSVVTVMITNVTRPYVAVRNGQVSFRPTTANSIPFEIAYDPNYIFPEDTYEVRASVVSGGREILQTVQAQPVITRGNPTKVRLNLASSAPGLASNPGTSVVTAGYPSYNAVNDQIAKIYMDYLGRAPTNGELAALQFAPNIQNKLSTLPIELMAQQEFYDRAGNNNQVWLQQVFSIIVGKQPTQAEYDQWSKRFADLRYSRTELLRQLYTVAPKR
jgi:uncharacterized lipoprotein YbaY